MLIDYLAKRKILPIVRLINKYVGRTLTFDDRKTLLEWMGEKDDKLTDFMKLYSLELKDACYRLNRISAKALLFVGVFHFQ